MCQSVTTESCEPHMCVSYMPCKQSSQQFGAQNTTLYQVPIHWIIQLNKLPRLFVPNCLCLIQFIQHSQTHAYTLARIRGRQRWRQRGKPMETDKETERGIRQTSDRQTFTNLTIPTPSEWLVKRSRFPRTYLHVFWSWQWVTCERGARYSERANSFDAAYWSHEHFHTSCWISVEWSWTA